MEQSTGGSQTDIVLELIGLIYDAVADAGRWPAFLEGLARAIGAPKATLMLRDVSGPNFAAVCWYGWSDEDVQTYAEKYALVDPWDRYSVAWPESAVGTDLDLCSREETEASLAFREFYLPRGAAHGLGATILVTETGRSVLAAQRGAESGPFSQAEQEIVRSLMPHLRRAALLHGELGALRRQLATVTGQLGRFLHPFFITDGLGRILYGNQQARQVAERSAGMSLEGGRFSLGRGERGLAFFKALEEICARKGEPIRRFLVQGTARANVCRVILISMEDSQVVPLGISLSAVTILLIDDSINRKLDVSVPQQMFALTPAEARVAGKLALGESIQEIAADLKVSVQTIRTHTKRIQGKTGTSRQGELVSLLLRSIPGWQAFLI